MIGHHVSKIVKGWLGVTLLLAGTASATDYVFLNSIVKDGADIRVTYGKNFNTCVHLLNLQKTIVHYQNFFCESGVNKISYRTVNDFNVPIQLGQLYQLCHGNNYNVCSVPVPVQGMPTLPTAYLSNFPTVNDPTLIGLGLIPSTIDVNSSWGPYRLASLYQAYLEAQARARAVAAAAYSGNSEYSSLFRNLANQRLVDEMNQAMAQAANRPIATGGSCNVTVYGARLRPVHCEQNYRIWLQSLPVNTAVSCYNSCLSQVDVSY